MRLYVEVARRAFRREATYRGALVAGAFTNIVFGFIHASVLRSALGDRTIAGLNQDRAEAFVFVTQALIVTTSVFGDYSLAALVRSGQIASELTRPWDWSLYRLANDLGRSSFAGLTRGVLICGVGWSVYRFTLPASGRWPLFLFSVVLASVLASRLWTVAGLVGFWLVDASGIVQMTVVAASFASGLLLPLSIFPDAVGQFLRWLPFAGLMQTPADMFVGTGSAMRGLALQVGWILALEGIVRIELGAALKKLVVQGG